MNEQFGSYNWWHKAKVYAWISNSASQITDLETIESKFTKADSDKAEVNVLEPPFVFLRSSPNYEDGYDPDAPYQIL